MGWSIGYDGSWDRDIGYGVPAQCDHPGCNTEIDRGIGFVCGSEPYGGEQGCGLYFCADHLLYDVDGARVCARCATSELPFEATPDIRQWVLHKLTDESWSEWRDANPDWVRDHQAAGGTE